MKTTSKRVISLLLAIMMVLSIFTIVPMTASAIELTDNALLESQDGDELTYSSNKFNEVGTSGGDSRLVFSESNITIADGTGNGADLTSNAYKDRVLALSKGTLIIKFKASSSSIYSLFSVSDSDQANKHYHIYVNNGVVGVEARNNDNSNNYNFKTSSAVITDKTGTNTIALKYENKTYTLFVNGKQYTFNQSGDRFISGIDGRDDIRLGATKRSGALQYKFTGEINFIKCYDVALSNEEIISFSKESLTELNCTANENEHTLTWNGTSNEGWTIKANGETVTPTSITCENDICTAVIPVTTVNDVTYTVENDTHYGSVTVESVAIPEISAKALYKTHKLEWTDSITDANFTVTSSAGEIASNNLSITYVDVGDVRNYTALVTVGTGVKAGTSYIVKKDGNNFGMGTVSETTSFDALKKNALLVVDYTKEDLGYKSFDGATNGVKVDGITDVQAAKLAKLTNGAIITSANYRNINGNQAIISLSGTSQACWFGTRNNNKQVGGEINNWLKGSLSGVTLTAGIHNSVIAYNSSNWFMGCDTTTPYTGNNDTSKGTFTCWTPNTANTGITKDSIYVGSTSSGANKFNGDVYYVIVSEESYVSADLSVFTGIHANKYNAFKSQITALESNIPQVTNDTFSVIDNDKYQTLKNTLETLKSYTITNNSDKELDSALDTINSQFASLDYKGNVVPVSNYILNANASVNTYANNGTTDGGVSFLFDGNTKINNNLTLWHTFYDGSNGQGHAGVTADNPAALQLGFGDVIKLKQVVCTPRKENSNEIANYTLYVSTADTMPALTTDISTKAELDSIINDSEKGWKQVKTGTLAKVIAGNQIITLDKAEDAKWMLLVMTSASETNNGGFQYIALSSMSIYRENSNIIKLDNNVVKEHAKVNSRPARSDGALAWGHDGGVECLFDTNEDGSFNLTTMLHSNYGYHATQNNAGAGATTVNAETPYCLQLGFDNAINLKKLCYYVRANEWDGGIPNQLKSYEIYVSNSETEPELTTDMQQKSDLIGDGWTLVKKGTVGCTTVPNDKKEIVFDAPVNAKWVRLVVTEAQGKTGATNDGLSITALEVYAEENAVLNTSTNFANDSAKWNNTTERVAILAKNATANVQETNRGVNFIFNGNYALNVAEGEFYGSWQTNQADRREPWIQTGFDESVCVSGIVIFDRLQNKDGSKIAQNCFNYYEVLLSNDANFENYIVAASGQRTDKSYSDQGYAIKFDQPYDCKYIKFVTHGDVDCKIVEMDIYEYVGMKSETATTVAIDTTACTVANDKLLKTVDFNFNKMFANGFTKAELEKQVLDIELSDISHNYEIVVGDDAQVSIVATDATYNLTVSANGTTTDNAQTKKYGENFDYTVENAKGWQVDGKVIANGNTFNFMATDDVTVTAITDTVSTEVSVYIPAPVVGFDGTKTTVQIPVYVNGTTPEQKGIVFVKTGTDLEIVKNAILGTANANVKISNANDAVLSNKGRYIHTIKANGKLTTGTFYAYVVVGGEVTLSNEQVIG